MVYLCNPPCTISLLICDPVCRRRSRRWCSRHPRSCIIAGSMAPFSVNIGETLTVNYLKKAARSEKKLDRPRPFKANTFKLYKSTSIDPTNGHTSTQCMIYPSIGATPRRQNLCKAIGYSLKRPGATERKTHILIRFLQMRQEIQVLVTSSRSSLHIFHSLIVNFSNGTPTPLLLLKRDPRSESIPSRACGDVAEM